VFVTDDDDPGPTRSVRMLRPKLPSKSSSRKAEQAPPVLPTTQPKSASVGIARKQTIDASGERFGPYCLLGEVGQGGMAEVRLAIEIFETGGLRLCVVKRAKRGAFNEEAIQALRDEAHVLDSLHHPNVIALYASGEIDGASFLAFELADGVSLRQLLTMIAPEAVPVRAVIEIGEQAAAALAYVHGEPHAVVHRDVTPQNILLARGGCVKLADFGIARYAERPSRTRKGMFKGKLGYLAPEQIARPAAISGRTDVFALGLVLTELLSGRRVLPAKVAIVAETEGLIREHCAAAEGPVPLALVELLVAMTSPKIEARPEASQVRATLKKLASRQEGPALADFAHQRALAKLLPLDLESVFALPTRPVEKLIADEDLEEDAYSATIRVLTDARLRAASRSGA
jgi:serine/threonine-protein kinase